MHRFICRFTAVLVCSHSTVAAEKPLVAFDFEDVGERSRRQPGSSPAENPSRSYWNATMIACGCRCRRSRRGGWWRSSERLCRNRGEPAIARTKIALIFHPNLPP